MSDRPPMHRLHILNVLRRLDLDVPRNFTGNQLAVACPLGDHRRRNTLLIVNLKTATCFCQGCKFKGSIQDLATRATGLDKYEMRSWLARCRPPTIQLLEPEEESPPGTVPPNTGIQRRIEI